MRIKNLKLDIFGKFNNKSFNFGIKKEGMSDFHVLVGPNEAGKTTTMEAYLRLIYGFPTKEKYGFLHDKKNLQVSGELEIKSNSLIVSRMSSKVGSLRDENKNTIPETSISSLLNGFSETQYRQLLCLDDETIEKGGDEIVNSKGDIGALLFSAAAGISDLTVILEEHRTKADQTYKKNARNTLVADLKRELNEVEIQIKDQDVNASTYEMLRNSIVIEEKNLKENRQEEKILSRKQSELNALKNTFKKISKIKELKDNLFDFQNFPKQLPVTNEVLIEIHSNQSILQSEKNRYEKKKIDYDDNLKKINRNPKYIHIASQLDNLSQSRSRYETANLDLERRIDKLQEISEDISNCLKELKCSELIDDYDILIKTAIERTKLDQIREKNRDDDQLVKNALSEVNSSKNNLKEIEEKIEDQSIINDEENSISEILKSYLFDNLLFNYKIADQEVNKTKDDYKKALSSLQNQDQSFDEVPKLVISSEDLSLNIQRIEKLNSEIEKLKTKRDDINDQLIKLNFKEKNIISNSKIIDDDTTSISFKERGDLWKFHKEALDINSANEFEKSMQSYDQINDIRFNQSADIGILRNIKNEIEENNIELKSINIKILKLEDDQSKQNKILKNYQDNLKLQNYINPSSFLGWIKKHEYAILAKKLLVDVENKHNKVFVSFNELLFKIKTQLKLETQDTDSIVEKAKRVQNKEQENFTTLHDLEKSKKWIKKELNNRNTNLKLLQKNCMENKREWEKLVVEMFSKTIEPDLLMISLKPLYDLVEINNEKQGLKRQINGMNQDVKVFKTAIEEICKDADIELSENPLLTFKKLSKLVSKAKEDENEFKNININKNNAKKQIEEINSKILGIQQQVKDFSKNFPPEQNINSISDLIKTMEIAKEVINNRKMVKEIEDEVKVMLNVSNMSEALNKQNHRSFIDIETELSTCSNDIVLNIKNLENAMNNSSLAKAQLQQVTGDDSIARLIEKKTLIEMQIEEAALQYLKVQFGLIVADQAIRKYRDKHRSAMLSATEHAFCKLTNGAYEKLDTKPFGKSEILLAIDNHGSSKEVNHLSKGTRYQLYLSLRAAAYEQLIKEEVSLPFFCDDIFETFDEERTRSACKLMEHIGTMGQSIYLTHHQHVVDIARNACGHNVTIHEL